MEVMGFLNLWKTWKAGNAIENWRTLIRNFGYVSAATNLKAENYNRSNIRSLGKKVLKFLSLTKFSFADE
jgi:uncharacterized protein with NRDE domain